MGDAKDQMITEVTGWQKFMWEAIMGRTRLYIVMEDPELEGTHKADRGMGIFLETEMDWCRIGAFKRH